MPTLFYKYVRCELENISIIPHINEITMNFILHIAVITSISLDFT